MSAFEVEKVVAYTDPGISIHSMALKSIRFAFDHMWTVEFQFNGRLIVVNPKAIVQDIVDQYGSQL